MQTILYMQLLTAALGFVALFALFGHTYRVLSRAKLDKHRYRGPATADLLNYARAVSDGVVLCKDGALTASWLYRGPDSASSPDAERNALVLRINQILAVKGRGWMLQTSSTRAEAPRYTSPEHSHFPDPITAAIDEERRQLFERRGAVFDGFFVMTLTYTPPRVATRRLLELLVDDTAVRKPPSDRSAALIAEFEAGCRNFELELSSSFKLQRLRRRVVKSDHGELIHDEQLRWINFCVTGESHPIALPSDQHRFYLDSVIGGQDLIGGRAPRIGRQHIRVVAIEGFPSLACPGILDALSEYPCKLRWDTRLIFLDAQQVETAFEKYRKKWKQKIVGFLDQVFQTNTNAIDRNALAMVEEVERAIADVKSGRTASGYYTSVVVLMDEREERVELLAREVADDINRWGFVARIESLNAMDAYLGSLPAHSAQNLRRPPMTTEQLAELMPTGTLWTGSDTAPCPFYPPNSPALMHCVTHGATPCRLNLHVGDLGHTLMFGPPGTGKSLHLALIAAQLRRYHKMTVFAFDKGNSMYALARAIQTATRGTSGLHLRPGADGAKFACCPLQYLDTRSDRAWAMSWIDTILRLNGLQTTPGQRNEIAEAITSMFYSSARTITEFVNTVQDEQIREALHQYTKHGACGQLLDADSDQLELSDFSVFEVEDLMAMDNRYALPVLLYLFRRIERTLRGQPAAIIIDEAWLMLLHPVFRDKITEWLKVLRRANCLVILATQSLSDVEKSGVFDVINESCPTKIFLPNPAARTHSALYTRMGVNEREIEIIAGAEEKRHYYYTSPDGRRLYELEPGPFAKCFIAQSGKDAVLRIEQLEAKHGDGWIDVWLRSQGQSPLAEAA